jgi:hypothetical protein
LVFLPDEEKEVEDHVEFAFSLLTGLRKWVLFVES